MQDWEFNDGSPPPDEICRKWFGLLSERFKSEPGSCVAVHCVAGLGREAEVGELDAQLAARALFHEQIARLEIAVDEAGFVHVIECCEHTARERLEGLCVDSSWNERAMRGGAREVLENEVGQAFRKWTAAGSS